jgi:hypothetical protein
LLGMSLSSCCRFNPASVNCRVSQFATFHVAFASTEASSANWGFRFSRPNLHLLSLRPDDLLTILKNGFVDRFRKFGFSPLRYPSYKVLTFTLMGLSPTEHTSFSWTHFRTVSFPQYGFKVGCRKVPSQHQASNCRAPSGLHPSFVPPAFKPVYPRAVSGQLCA